MIVKIQGRPEDQLILQWLESEAGTESYTLTELHDKMNEISDNFTIERLKQSSRNIIKNSYSLWKLRGVVMPYALRIWQNISVSSCLDWV